MQPFPEGPLWSYCFLGQNVCPNLELQILLGKGCSFHPCWKELGPLWLTVKRKKAEMNL